MQENKSLKILRVRYGLTQEAIAEKLGISRQAYAKVENGQAAGSISFWIKMQFAFDITSEEMWKLINDEAEEGAKV